MKNIEIAIGKELKVVNEKEIRDAQRWFCVCNNEPNKRTLVLSKKEFDLIDACISYTCKNAPEHIDHKDAVEIVKKSYGVYCDNVTHNIEAEEVFIQDDGCLTFWRNNEMIAAFNEYKHFVRF